MKALIVDDDLVLADVLSFTLRRAGFLVITAHDGQAALDTWQAESPDLIVLDLNLPRIDGLTVCQRIREKTSTPILILSVRGEDDDVVRALELGADDYITKPFSPRQLVARVQAVLRRSGVTPTTGPLVIGDLTLDLARRELYRSGQLLAQLTALECRLMEVLMLNSGHVLPADTLITQVWGPAGGDRTMLKQLVHRLRVKIEPDPSSPVYLETVPGVGYALVNRFSPEP
ncbi:MAG TPA: response regulator transcription factor [Aggregatilineaceae bacterium]|nr:response regulator transcription factor [Aggregatilineaceae bacterium]